MSASDRYSGNWSVWWDENGKPVVGWLPSDELASERHVIDVASDRDAHILCDVLTALEAKPR